MAETGFDAPPRIVSDEATEEQLSLANEQGNATKRALEKMTHEVAHDGGEKTAGQYLVAYAVEEAEGMYELVGGNLEWRDPGDANLHLEVCVRDGADGRFIPALEVYATLIDGDGNEVATHRQPFLWHPWLYHYGRNWKVAGDGEYRLRVRIEPPTFGRHDKKNGLRYAEAVEVEFERVQIKTGKK